MTDEQLEGEQLTGLFADGTAPERDAAFARRVDARIASERRGFRLAALAVRALVTLMLASALFVTVRELGPTLQQIVSASPQFMGVPLPLILIVLAIGLAVRALRFVRFRLG
jgi:hypothetical protein